MPYPTPLIIDAPTLAKLHLVEGDMTIASLLGPDENVEQLFIPYGRRLLMEDFIQN